MPDENPGAAEAAPDAPAATQEPKATQDAVSYTRFTEVNEQAKSLKAQLADAQRALQEREEADLSAADREKARAARAEEDAAAARAESAELKRGSWLTKAAADAGFSDPSFAAEALSGKADIDSEAQAAKAVKRLAERSPGLLSTQKAPPQIGQVLQNGSPVDAKAATEAGAKHEFESSIREAFGFPTQ